MIGRAKLRRLARRLLRKTARPRPRPRQAWCIGVLSGPAPDQLADAPPGVNPVLTREDVFDVPARFVADPFMLLIDGRWHMFMEVLNSATRRGEIGLAVSDDLVRWRYQGTVLREPFHLSYPYVFEWDGEHYMIPEACQSLTVRLYRARAFPRDWVHVHTLLTGGWFIDSSVIRLDGHWWMFVQTSPPPRNETLSLYVAPDLTGPWREHPASPIVPRDPRIARPAGRLIHDGRRLYRFAQECLPFYGSAVRAFDVVQLTPTAYREVPVAPNPILHGSGRGWNAHGMHHLDAHPLPDGGWVACVDGWQWAPPPA